MDTFVAVFWLIGQALSIIALFLGLALSLMYWRLREPASAPAIDEEAFVGRGAEIRKAA